MYAQLLNFMSCYTHWLLKPRMKTRSKITFGRKRKIECFLDGVACYVKNLRSASNVLWWSTSGRHPSGSVTPIYVVSCDSGFNMKCISIARSLLERDAEKMGKLGCFTAKKIRGLISSYLRKDLHFVSDRKDLKYVRTNIPQISLRLKVLLLQYPASASEHQNRLPWQLMNPPCR